MTNQVVGRLLSQQAETLEELQEQIDEIQRKLDSLPEDVVGESS